MNVIHEHPVFQGVWIPHKYKVLFKFERFFHLLCRYFGLGFSIRLEVLFQKGGQLLTVHSCGKTEFS